MLTKILNLIKGTPSGEEKDGKAVVGGVADFYNQNTEKFLEVYGHIIQAFRTNDVSVYLDYTMKNAELEDGLRVLDAGCGVGGPACYFASKVDIEVQGLTISEKQVTLSKDVVDKASLKGKVSIKQGDYHKLTELYDRNSFDRVLFLESFGHSPNKPLLIEQVFEVLKPGGIIYIKDLFKREHPNEEDGKKIDRIIQEINRAYCYQVGDLYEVLRTLRRLNFILLFVKTPEVKVGEFEHLTISNDFQNLFDIGKIISWEDYVFPIDFYEIKAMKPPFDLDKEKHLYFLNRPEVAKGESTK